MNCEKEVPFIEGAEFQPISCDKDVLVGKYETKDCSKTDDKFIGTQL